MTASRITGRGAIIRTLRLLLIRVARYAQHRAASAAEHAWADDPAVRADLARVEQRAAVSRKVRP